MSKTCPNNCPNMSPTCPKHFPNMSQACPKHVKHMIQKCKHIICWSCNIQYAQTQVVVNCFSFFPRTFWFYFLVFSCGLMSNNFGLERSGRLKRTKISQISSNTHGMVTSYDAKTKINDYLHVIVKTNTTLKKRNKKQNELNLSFIFFFLLFVGLLTPEFLIFDLNIGFLSKNCVV